MFARPIVARLVETSNTKGDANIIHGEFLGATTGHVDQLGETTIRRTRASPGLEDYALIDSDAQAC
eukprot:10928962-Lingulodinium_polyedra.AAC.1